MDWQPIETAPKDGTEIILSDGDTSFAGFYHDGSQCRRSDAGFFFESDRDNLLTARNVHAVKWMPFPAA